MVVNESCPFTNYSVVVSIKFNQKGNRSVIVCWMSLRLVTVPFCIAAPPMLQADDDLIMDCHGEHRDHCFVRSVDSFPVSGSQSINMTASYRGEGPFSVQWYHNGETFDNSSLKGAFRGMTTTSTSQVCAIIQKL